MSDGNHHERREDLASYLLGALEPGEAADLERHVAGCEECRTELARLRPAVWALPASVERVEPPPRLRARIMDEVRTDAAPTAIEAGGRATRSRRWLGGQAMPLRWAAGLAAIAAIVAGVTAYAVRDAGSGEDVTTVLAGEAPGVTAKMVSEGDSGTLRLANLHRLPSDEVLQAWVERDQQVEPVGDTFVPGSDGTATAAIADMSGVETVMVTVEPHGGSEQPTSTPLVSVSVPQ